MTHLSCGPRARGDLLVWSWRGKPSDWQYLLLFVRFFLLLFILPDSCWSIADGFLPPVCWRLSRFLVGTGILTTFPMTAWRRKDPFSRPWMSRTRGCTDMRVREWVRLQLSLLLLPIYLCDAFTFDGNAWFLARWRRRRTQRDGEKRRRWGCG